MRIDLRYVVLFLLIPIDGAFGQANSGPIPIDQARTKIGRFQVLLTERNPLSKPADVAVRTSQTVAASDGDYELSKEPFEAFVPKSAGNDGKYGLMIPMPFPGHGFPPPKWVDVLEKHHIIWLGDNTAGDGRAPLQRIGLALDAVHDAEKVWQIDPARVYICPASPSPVASGIALYYPDVFQGQICEVVFGWYAQITDARTRLIFKTNSFPRPKPEQFALAHSRSRFFFACVQPDSPNSVDEGSVVVKEGYERAGFKHVKAVYLSKTEITVWSAYPASWFEEGLEFLDAGAAEANAQVTKAAATAASSKAGSAASAASNEDDAARKAASALSLAKNYINAGQYEPARKKLQSIIQTYASTPAAEDAKKLLLEIKDK